MPMMHIDGSNLGSGKASAWACVIELDRDQAPAPMHNQILSDAYAEGTIGRMELMALTHALLAIDAFFEAAQGPIQDATAFVRPSDIWTITTDSQFVANGFNDWMEGWARNAWRKSSNKEVAHVDLWEIVRRLKEKHAGRITVQWVRGHNGHPGNTKADEWANRSARMMNLGQNSLSNNILRIGQDRGEFLSKQIELSLSSEVSTTAQSPAEPTVEPAKKVVQTTSTATSSHVVPISELTARHGHVLLIGPSGYQGTPFRAAVGRMTPHGRIVDHAGDLFTDGGEDATHFLPLPWNNS